MFYTEITGNEGTTVLCSARLAFFNHDCSTYVQIEFITCVTIGKKAHYR